MSRKILSVMLSLIMVLAMCTVAFVSTGAASDYATVKYGNQSWQVKVGDTFTVKAAVTVPNGYSLAGGKFVVYYNPDIVEAVMVDEYDETYCITDIPFMSNLIKVDGIIASGDGVSFAMGAVKYNKNLQLTTAKNNFATFTLKVTSPGTCEITTDLEFSLYAETAPTTVINNVVSGGVVDTSLGIPVTANVIVNA